MSISIGLNVEAWHLVALQRDNASSMAAQVAVLDLYVTVLEMESAQRGYIITTNVIDADEYYVAVNRMQVAREKVTVVAEPIFTARQKRDLADFDNILKQKIAEMDSTIAVASHIAPSAAVKIVQNQLGLRMMIRLKALKDSMLQVKR